MDLSLCSLKMCPSRACGRLRGSARARGTLSVRAAFTLTNASGNATAHSKPAVSVGSSASSDVRISGPNGEGRVGLGNEWSSVGIRVCRVGHVTVCQRAASRLAVSQLPSPASSHSPTCPTFAAAADQHAVITQKGGRERAGREGAGPHGCACPTAARASAVGERAGQTHARQSGPFPFPMILEGRPLSGPEVVPHGMGAVHLCWSECRSLSCRLHKLPGVCPTPPLRPCAQASRPS